MLFENKPDASKMGGFFALLMKDNWYVYFGKLSPEQDKYLPRYVLSAPRKHLKQFHPIKLEDAPPIGPAYARAVSASALHAAKETGNPGVNPILVPQPSGELEVYVVQGSKEPGVMLLGGDWHDRWDAAGTKLLSREQLHKSVIPQRDSDTPADAELAGSFHTHLLIEGPSATDVMSVLQNPKIAPMFVLGKSGAIYRLDRDGSIHTMDRAQLKAQGLEFPEPDAEPQK